MNRLMPGTRALKTFESAARHLNFTRAADEVGLTPAAVSYQIKEIEEQLGVALFVRTSRTIRLTPSGRILFDATVEALDVLQRAVSRARRTERGEGQLKVSMSPTFASRWVMPRIERFNTLHPEITLRFDISYELRDFDHDDVDVGVRFGAGKYPGLRADRLFDDVSIPVCSPALLKGGKPLNTPRDLLQHTLIHIEWSYQGITWPNWRMWMAAAGVEDFDDRNCVTFDDSSHIIQAALEGHGVALADFSMVARELSEGRLVRPFELGISVPPEFAYFLAYPEDNANDPRIVAFRDWILAEAAARPEGALRLKQPARTATAKRSSSSPQRLRDRG